MAEQFNESLTLNEQTSSSAAIGHDGIITLLISNLFLLCSFGLIYWLLLYKVIQTARHTALYPRQMLEQYRVILIAGLKLQNNLPDNEYKTRLDRAVVLLQKRANSNSPTADIILLGGITGNNRVSEAKAGSDYLQTLGIQSVQIICDDHSRHTLENLHHARRILKHKLHLHSTDRVIIISSRYHIHRIVTLAKGLKLPVDPVAAEEQLLWTPLTVFKIFKEAWFLHWYWSGKAWVSLTGNQNSRKRIS